MSLESANTLVGFATLATQLVALALFAIYFLRHRSPVAAEFARIIGRYGIWIALTLTGFASVITVYYSAILGLEPCPLCWWQRAFLYPQVVLFAVSLWKREHQVACYSIALSVIGALIALYQHALQMLPGSGLPCPATGVSCAQRVLFEFNYVTFPLAAVTIFLCVIALMLIVRKR